MKNKYLDNYANLIVKFGVNIQPDQILVINTPIECADFARLIASKAYDVGARDVVMNWRDELSSKLRFEKASDKVFEECPEWQKKFYNEYAQQGAAFVSLAAGDPELLKDIDPARISKSQKTLNTALMDYRERLMNNENSWCVISMPTMSWAKKVFPDQDEQQAFDSLLKAILKTVRADQDDVIGAWKTLKDEFAKRLDILNGYKISKLHYTNSLGTDLSIGLNKNHLWLAATEKTKQGIEFIANIPTEEIFTLPDRKKVNGVVYSSKPLNYNGNIIDEFKLVFKDGKVVDFSAKKGADVLKHLLATDEGAAYLGEVALVPHDSPISNTNILFYNTLFDENASCHLAFGKAYKSCLQEPLRSSGNKDDLVNAGVNDSLVHVDFMIGTDDLSIVAETIDGNEVVIFKNGNFVF